MVECNGLENRQTARSRGFESLSLRPDDVFLLLKKGREVRRREADAFLHLREGFEGRKPCCTSIMARATARPAPGGVEAEAETTEGESLSLRPDDVFLLLKKGREVRRREADAFLHLREGFEGRKPCCTSIVARATARPAPGGVEAEAETTEGESLSGP